MAARLGTVVGISWVLANVCEKYFTLALVLYYLWLYYIIQHKQHARICLSDDENESDLLHDTL